MNRFWTFFLIAFGFMLTGCSTGRIASLNRKPNEAIIIAKIIVFFKRPKHFSTKFLLKNLCACTAINLVEI